MHFSNFIMVQRFEPVLNSSVPVLFSSEKNLSVQFSVLKKWGENRTELNFGNTRRNDGRFDQEGLRVFVAMRTAT